MRGDWRGSLGEWLRTRVAVNPLGQRRISHLLLDALIARWPPWCGYVSAVLFVGLTTGRRSALASKDRQYAACHGGPLSVCESDYWSEFFRLGEAEDNRRPVVLAASILDEFSKTQTTRVRWARCGAAQNAPSGRPLFGRTVWHEGHLGLAAHRHQANGKVRPERAKLG